MEVLELIEKLNEEIENAAPLFFGGRCVINREEIMQLLQDIEVHLPDDLKQAQWIKDERERILSEAKAEADEIIRSANEQLISMINENEITKKAQERAEVILERTQHSANEIKISSYKYSDDLLEKVQHTVSNSMRDLERIMRTIEENRRELK